MTLIPVAGKLKFLIICVFSEHDYWSAFNHRWHIYSKTWATFVRPTILIDLEGSWFMNKFLTSTTDMQIGEDSYLACADAFREHDLVRIGKGSVINTFGELRTHTFENWKLRMDVITVGDYCTVGQGSTLMTKTQTLDFTEVGPNTLVMKNEVLAEDTYYASLPAIPMGKSKVAVARDHGSVGVEQDVKSSLQRPCLVAMVLAALIAGIALSVVLSLQEPQQPAPVVPKLTNTCITMVGDTMIENGSKDYAESLANPREAFLNVEALLSKCPFVLANLEGPVTSLGIEHDPRQSYQEVNPAYSFNMDPSVVPSLLAKVGITHLGRSNNHLRDRGEAGVADTTRYLKEAGLPSFGFGLTEEEAAMPLMLKTVGITGFADVYNGKDVEAGTLQRESGILPVTEEHASLGQRLLQENGAHLKIAFVHWGDNYGAVSDSTREMAGLLARHGYDLIIGSDGSHTVQEFDFVDTVPILYNLGNFVFQTPGRFEREEALPYGSVVSIHLDGNGQLSFLELHCAYVDNRIVEYKPKPCNAAQAKSLFSTLGEYVEHAEGTNYAIVDLKRKTKAT